MAKRNNLERQKCLWERKEREKPKLQHRASIDWILTEGVSFMWLLQKGSIDTESWFYHRMAITVTTRLYASGRIAILIQDDRHGGSNLSTESPKHDPVQLMTPLDRSSFMLRALRAFAEGSLPRGNMEWWLRARADSYQHTNLREPAECCVGSVERHHALKSITNNRNNNSSGFETRSWGHNGNIRYR